MIIRKYAEFPAVIVPDIGEVIEARRSAADQFTRCVVLMCTRQRSGKVRIKVQWLADDPAAGSYEPIPIVAGTVGWVTHDPGSPAVTIRQFDAPSMGSEGLASESVKTSGP